MMSGQRAAEHKAGATVVKRLGDACQIASVGQDAARFCRQCRQVTPLHRREARKKLQWL